MKRGVFFREKFQKFLTFSGGEKLENSPCTNMIRKLKMPSIKFVRFWILSLHNEIVLIIFFRNYIIIYGKKRTSGLNRKSFFRRIHEDQTMINICEKNSKSNFWLEKIWNLHLTINCTGPNLVPMSLDR